MHVRMLRACASLRMRAVKSAFAVQHACVLCRRCFAACGEASIVVVACTHESCTCLHFNLDLLLRQLESRPCRVPMHDDQLSLFIFPHMTYLLAGARCRH